jgi:4-amino-4-deoxy-L-arabinose transferase-like glycosyltransferase
LSKDKAKNRKPDKDTPSPATNTPAALSPLARRLLPWAGVLLVVVMVATVRVRLADLPLERDEGEYAYAGQLMLEGIPPYELAYNMKFPGVYGAYAAMMAVFGQTTKGIHLGMTVVNIGAIVLVFLLGRRLINAWTGVLAAAAYGIMALSPSVLGLAGHATHFVVLAAAGGLLLLLRGIEKNSLLAFLWSGLCLGTAVLMKQHGAMFAVAAGLFLVWATLTRWPIRPLRSLTQLGLLVAGTFIPFCITCVTLYAAGVFDTFWFWTFKYASEYASVVSFSDGMKNLEMVFPYRMGAATGLWVMAGAGLATAVALAVVRRQRKDADLAIFLVLLTACSFVATGAGYYWRDHYFILMLPAVALAAGAAAGLAIEATSKKSSMWPLAAAMILTFACVFGYAFMDQRDTFFTMKSTDVCRSMYGPNPFPESYPIADYLKAHTGPDDRIAVLGSEPQLLFLSHRRSSTGYIYMYGLMEPQPYAPEMQAKMEKEIQDHPPKYIVMVSPHPGLRMSWLWYPDMSHMDLFGWMEKWIRDRYHVEGMVLIAAARSSADGSVEWRDTWVWNTPENPAATLEAAEIEKRLTAQWTYQMDVLTGRKPAPASPSEMPQFWSNLFLGRAGGAPGPMPQARPPWFAWELPVVVVLRENEKH